MARAGCKTRREKWNNAAKGVPDDDDDDGDDGDDDDDDRRNDDDVNKVSAVGTETSDETTRDHTRLYQTVRDFTKLDRARIDYINETTLHYTTLYYTMPDYSVYVGGIGSSRAAKANIRKNNYR
jgi:hypothetical protein